MSELTDQIEGGAGLADASNHVMSEAVIARAAQIGELLDAIDHDLALFLEPEADGWAYNESTACDLLAAWLAVSEVSARLAKVVKYSEDITTKALGRTTITIDGRGYRARRAERRNYPAEKKSELRDVMVRHVARAVALNPLTGELDADRARVAQETLTQFDQWQTINPASFKSSHLKKVGVDLDEYSEAEVSYKVVEVPS